MRKIKKIICFAILWSSFLSFSQQQKIDSIEKVLKSKLTLTDRALRLKDLAMYYELVDTTMSIKYYDEAINFAKKTN